MPGANPPTTHPDDGWPFRATNNWSRDKSVVGSVDLHAHDTGKIIRHSGQGWVEVSIPRRRIGRGVVPKSYIEVGTDNKWGEWKVNVTVTLTVPKPPSVNLPTGSVLYKTVYALLHDIRASSANLEELSGRSKSLLGEHGGSNDPIKRIAGALCEGAQKAGTFNVLNKPNFTERDLFSQAKLVGAIDKRAKQIGGIYAWRHSGFKDVTHKPAIAVGSTIDFPQRKGGHATQSKTDTAPQYRAWRASTVHQMYALIELSIGRDDREEMYWIELVMFLLLDSYHPGLFAMSIEEKMREKYTTEEEDGSGNAPRNEDDPPGTTTEKVISAVTWAIIAKKLRAIMDGVRQRTGWQRRGYLGTTGLNWASPGGGPVSKRGLQINATLHNQERRRGVYYPRLAAERTNW
ncbi:hypothetical protein BDY17DRAFT_320549 [Neohortaea acidophila]|uniref:Uncharacterized protein n=1 Tax=Neohortaea acidophila TaxID=245834 RepID=A0A6A6Q7R8_9PEZI|nr:uncharacterized protein BDY17DRAFT_320549 [Neohortaea acidophila]KAF2488044.1 hypothetical protein BDY17DRAFT_320549 [Neohortaea acidophila]